MLTKWYCECTTWRWESGKNQNLKSTAVLQWYHIVTVSHCEVSHIFNLYLCPIVTKTGRATCERAIRYPAGTIPLFQNNMLYKWNQWSVDSVTEAASFKPKLVESKGRYLWSHGLLHDWLKGRAGFITNRINSLCWLSSILMDILLM